jgi:hypothetical protein
MSERPPLGMVMYVTLEGPPRLPTWQGAPFSIDVEHEYIRSPPSTSASEPHRAHVATQEDGQSRLSLAGRNILFALSEFGLEIFPRAAHSTNLAEQGPSRSDRHNHLHAARKAERRADRMRLAARLASARLS